MNEEQRALIVRIEGMAQEVIEHGTTGKIVAVVDSDTDLDDVIHTEAGEIRIIRSVYCPPGTIYVGEPAFVNQLIWREYGVYLRRFGPEEMLRRAESE